MSMQCVEVLAKERSDTSVQSVWKSLPRSDQSRVSSVWKSLPRSDQRSGYGPQLH